MINICAYTAPGGDYPAYVSINAEGREVSITVRSPASVGVGLDRDGKNQLAATCGQAAKIVLSSEEFSALLQDAVRHGAELGCA